MDHPENEASWIKDFCLAPLKMKHSGFLPKPEYRGSKKNPHCPSQSIGSNKSPQPNPEYRGSNNQTEIPSPSQSIRKSNKNPQIKRVFLNLGRIYTFKLLSCFSQCEKVPIFHLAPRPPTHHHPLRI